MWPPYKWSVGVLKNGLRYSVNFFIEKQWIAVVIGDVVSLIFQNFQKSFQDGGRIWKHRKEMVVISEIRYTITDMKLDLRRTNLLE